MADLKQQFEKAATQVKSLTERPDNDTMLRLYALFKQGSEGDVKGAKPGFLDFVGSAKYEAWEKLQGVAPEHPGSVDRIARRLLDFKAVKADDPIEEQ